jgi:hypothetical protein
MTQQQKITKQEDGSFRVVLGIADGMTKDNLRFTRAIVEAELARMNERGRFAEWGYPVQPDGVGTWEHHARLQAISMPRACGKWSDLHIENLHDGVVDQPMIVGTFRPWGSMADDVVRLLDHNPPKARFGYRACKFSYTVDGVPVPTVVNIITWDLIPND